ncbi:MAG: sigma-70 family RNA polymerase sigma factor [Ignavibacteriaceae bacterium]
MQLNANSPDIDVMKRVAAYDSKALEILYNRYAPLLYTLIKKIAVEKILAEEILTEVFVIIWRRVELFDVYSGNVYTWLITLARNKAVDTVRRKNENLKMPEYTDEYEGNFIVPQLSKQIDPLDLVTTFTIKDSVEAALNRLTDAQQYVIYLAYYEGLTQKEIAERLNIPYPTVKSKIKIASLNLREYLLKGDS